MQDLTPYITVVGAAPAAVILTTAARALGLASKWARQFAVAAGIVVVVAATWIVMGFTAAGLFLSLLVGAEAGLAAWATFDLQKSGVNYDVFPTDRESR